MQLFAFQLLLLWVLVLNNMLPRLLPDRLLPILRSPLVLYGALLLQIYFFIEIAFPHPNMSRNMFNAVIVFVVFLLTLQLPPELFVFQFLAVIIASIYYLRSRPAVVNSVHG